MSGFSGFAKSFKSSSSGAVAAPATATSLVWSASTESDTGSMEGGGSTFGTTTADVVLDAVHGVWDNGMDGYARYWNIGARPAGKRMLVIKMALRNSQNANASGGNEYLHIGAATEVPLAVQDGQVGGVLQNSSDVWKTANAERLGSVSAGDIIGDPSGKTITLYVPFGTSASADKMGPATVHTEGAAATDSDAASLVAASVPTDVFVFVGFGLQAPLPSAGQTWTLGEVTYEWLA